MKSIEKFNEWKQKVTDKSLLKQLEKMENDPVASRMLFTKILNSARAV